MSTFASPSRQRSQKWTAEEVEILKQSVQAQEHKGNGRVSWPLIAKALKGRTGKQCREKWKSDLAPDVTKDPYTSQEEYILSRAHSIHGNMWSALTRYLPGRSQNSIKNLMNASLRREERKRQAAALASSKPVNSAFILTDLLQGPHCPHLSLLGFYCRLLTENGVLGGGNLAVQLDLPSLFDQAVELYESVPEGIIPPLSTIRAPDEYFANAVTASFSRQDVSTASASMMARTPISKRKAVSKRGKGRKEEASDDGHEEDEEDLEEEDEEEGDADDEGVDQALAEDPITKGLPPPSSLCLPIDFSGLFNPLGGFVSKALEGAGASSLPWEAAPPLLTTQASSHPQDNHQHHGVLLTVAPLDIGTCGGDSSNLHHLGPLSNESTISHQAGLLSSASLNGIASGFLPLISSGSLHHHHLAPSPKQSLWLSSLCCGASRTDWQSEGLPATARASVAQSTGPLLPLTSSLPLLPDLYCSSFALDASGKSGNLNLNRQSKIISTYPPLNKVNSMPAVNKPGGKRGRAQYTHDDEEEEEEVGQGQARGSKDGSEEDEESQMRDAAEVLHSLFHSSSSSAGQPPVNQRAHAKDKTSDKRQAAPAKRPRIAKKRHAADDDDEDDEDYELSDDDKDLGRYGRGGGGGGGAGARSKKGVTKAASAAKEADEEGQAFLSAAALHLTANHDDGWRWRKYGEKAIKGQADVMRSYYKCSQPNCVAKKVVQWSLKGGEMAPEYKGIHSHLPPAPHGVSKRQQVAREVGEEESEGQAEC